jgi:cytochrome c oxidase subunit II
MKGSYIVGATLAAIVLCTSALSHARDTQAAPKRVEITAKRFAFSPSEITLKQGEPVELVLMSADVAHGLRCRELNIDLKVSKGGTTEAHFTPDKVGDFVAHCAVFCGSGHGQMAITIHVVE